MLLAVACAGAAFACLAVVHGRLQVRRARSERNRIAQRFHAVFDSATLGISIGADGRMLETNHAFQEMLGYSGAELSHMHHAELTHPDDVEGDVAQLEMLLRGELDSYRLEKRYLRRDGQVLWADVRVSLAHDGDGRPVFGGSITEDITGRKQLENQLRHSQKMEAVGSLAGGVAHDFNNVLLAIGGYSELLLRELEEGHARRRRVTEIQKAAGRATALTRQLLGFSRKQVLQPQLVDLNDVVAGIEPVLRRLIRENIALRVDAQSWPLTVLADPGQLDQVVLNLALNARDAMPDGGELSISAGSRTSMPGRPMRSACGRHCHVSVSDTGVGMDSDTQARVFEPFFTTKAAGEGTGLGLSTVYGIVAQSGGAVSVESAPGAGSFFTVYLPERLDPVGQPTVPAHARSIAVYAGLSRRDCLGRVERRQPVDRGCVALSYVVPHALLPLSVEPEPALRSLAGVLHQWHAVSARVRDPLDVDADDPADTVAGILARDHLAAPVETDDARRPLEGAEHHDDAPVLAEMRDRLGAAADVVVVLDGVRVDDPQRVDRPFRAQIDPPPAGSGGDEEERLRTYPSRKLRVDAVEHLAHERQPIVALAPPGRGQSPFRPERNREAATSSRPRS